jgi:hypothetical protein
MSADPSAVPAEHADAKPAAPNATPIAAIGHGEERERGLTLRALAVAFVGLAAIALYSDMNAMVVKAGPPLAGNELPILPVCMVVAIAAIWNPLAGRLSNRLRFRTRELAVSLVIMLSISWIAGYGIIRELPLQVVRPYLQNPGRADWQQEHTVSYLPAQASPLGRDRDDPLHEKVYSGLESGISGHGTRVISWREVPWSAWLPCLADWAPLLLLIAVVLMALAALVHRQWSKHEQLAYPLAQVFTAILPGPGGTLPPLLRSKMFWLGMAPPAVILINNYLSAWTHGEHFPWIWLMFFLSSDLGGMFPILPKLGYNGISFFSFMLTGIAFFLPMEVSFSIATGYMVFVLLAIPIFLVTGSPVPGPDSKNMVSGAFLAYAFILLYTGRTYFLGVFRRALARLKHGDPDPMGPWAARVLIVGGAALVWWLHLGFDMDPVIAVIYVLAMLLFFLVVMRIVVETGMPFFQSEMDFGMGLSNLLGLPALGPQSIVIFAWLGKIINFDNRACLPPFAANALKVAENTGLRLPPLIPVVLVAITVCIAMSLAAKLWFSYAFGARLDEYYGGTALGMDPATADLRTLREDGLLHVAAAASGFDHLALVTQNVGHARNLAFTGIGALALALTCLLRYRFAWFPFHPLIFLMWETWPSKYMWFSFLVGWAFKKAIVTYGGARGYELAKPFFLGLIMGEVLVAGLMILCHLIVYLITGQTVNGSLGYA